MVPLPRGSETFAKSNVFQRFQIFRWTGLPAQGCLLTRLPIMVLPMTVASQVFVPFTAAGQRGHFTPLPHIHRLWQYTKRRLQVKEKIYA